MADASYIQTSFLGGEWGPYAQGRMDDPRYRTGMNVCRNVIPVEEGAATRRPGTRWCETTRKGRPARIRPFAFEREQPYMMEFTEEKLRFFSGADLVLEEVAGGVVAISGTAPAEITTDHLHGLTAGEAVRFVNATSEDNVSLAGVARLLNRTWEVFSVGSTTTFVIADPVTGDGIDGALLDLSGITMEVARVLEVDTPYVDQDSLAVDIVQDEDEVLILHGAYPPRVLSDTTVAGDPVKSFEIDVGDFIDGPYMDPITDGTVLTPSGITGSITLTLSGGTAYTFVATDVGRLIRLYSQPAVWNSGTSYSAGDSVTYNNSFYTALTDNDGMQPDISLSDWALDPSAAIWTWGEITAFTSGSIVTLLVKGDALLSTTPVREWRLGLYSATTGYPYTGTIHEGRLWLAGATPNRIDGSFANGDLLDFTPTAPDGTVADNNACSFVLRAPTQNPVSWLMTDDQGIIIGTQDGEWLLRASQLNDPITPTSVQAKRMTNNGCSDARPVRAGGSTLFVQRHKRRLIEYTAFAEARFLGSNLAVTAQHLTKNQIVEIAYQQEKTPIVWALCADGSLLGMTYKRDNPAGTQAAQFAGWHRHDLGSDRIVTSIASGPSVGGEIDSTMVVTLNAGTDDTDVYWVEILTDIFGEENVVTDAWFVDAASCPVAATRTGDNITFYGLNHLVGETVAVWAAGVDIGDYLVATDGSITVTLGTPALFTEELLQELTDSGSLFEHLGVLVKQTGQEGVWTGDGILRMTRVAATPSTDLGFGAADWQNNRFLSRGSGGTVGWRLFNLTTGAEVTTRDQDGSFGALEPFSFCWETGYIHGYETQGTDRAVLFNPVSLAEEDSVAGIPLPGGIVPLGGGRYSLITASSHSEFNLDNGILVADFTGGTLDAMTTPSWTRFGATAKHTNAQPGRGFYTSGVAAGYVASYRTTHNAQGNATAKTCVMGQLHRVSVIDGVATILTVANITPQMIDPEWTHITEMNGCLLDESDGNVVLSAYISQPPAYAGGELRYDAVLASNGNVYWNKIDTAVTDPAVDPTDWENLGAWADITEFRYVFKVNTQTGAVMWATPIDQWADDTTEIPQSDHLYGSRCKFGNWFWYVETDVAEKYILEFDLSDGSVTAHDIDNVTESENVQASDDVTARLFAKFAYAGAGTNAPDPVSPTPSTFSTDWAVLINDPGALADPYFIPAVIGFTYTSQGQILRPIAQEETGALQGPALGKTRRSHQFASLLHNTQGISFATTYDRMRPWAFKTPGGTAYANNVLWSGTIQNTIEDDYSFDSMPAWEVTRPYPATVLTIGAFLQTQDR